MTLFGLGKKDDSTDSALNPFAAIEDLGTRRAAESIAKIVVGSLVAYAFGKGFLTESQAADMTSKTVEVLGYAVVLYMSWRKAHHVEKEIAVANALPRGTARDVIHDTAASPALKDASPAEISRMMPPPSMPLPLKAEMGWLPVPPEKP